MKVRDLVKRVEGDGWRLVRTKGSHRQFRHGSKRALPPLQAIPGSMSLPVRWTACWSRQASRS